MVSKRGRQRTGRLLWLGVASSVPGNLAFGTQCGVAVVDSQDVNDLVSHGGTIKRCLGYFEIRPDAIDETGQIMRVSIITMNADAFTAGAFPDPQTDAADFMWEGQLSATPAADVDKRDWRRMDIDIKAQRRLREFNRSLVFILHNIHTGFGLEFTFSLKVLVHVP